MKQKGWRSEGGFSGLYLAPHRMRSDLHISLCCSFYCLKKEKKKKTQPELISVAESAPATAG